MSAPTITADRRLNTMINSDEMTEKEKKDHTVIIEDEDGRVLLV